MLRLRTPILNVTEYLEQLLASGIQPADLPLIQPLYQHRIWQQLAPGTVPTGSPMRWEELRYRPHLARFGGHEIVVVVCDRELSDAQEVGTDAGWFIREVGERTRFCDFPPLAPRHRLDPVDRLPGPATRSPMSPT
jgi:hypothetical protein